MGEAERYLEAKNKKSYWRFAAAGNGVAQLLYIQLGWLVVLLFLQVSYIVVQGNTVQFYSDVVNRFMLPGSVANFIRQPWSIVTYSFTSLGLPIFEIFFQLLWMYGFAKMLQQSFGNSHIMPVYLTGSIVAAIFFIAANLLQKNTGLVTYLHGPQAGIISLAMAATIANPQDKIFRDFFGGIKLWFFTLLYFAYIIYKNQSVVSIIAFAGAAVMGAAYIVLCKKEIFINEWPRNVYEAVKGLFQKKNVVNNKMNDYEKLKQPAFTKKEIATQKRIDEILDKISANGINSLTEAEKQLLLQRAGDAD